ncbi:hypothetical protein V8E54_012072 [Elaphomyces granulatus]
MIPPSGKHKDAQQKVSPGPTYMSSDQVARYLRDLRTNHPLRPNGSRPQPGKTVFSQLDVEEELPPRAASALSMSRRPGASPIDQLASEVYPRSASALSHHRSTSEVSLGSSAGRPLAQEPLNYSSRVSIGSMAGITRSGALSPNGIYRESGQRWMERQEARSLRDALEEMDLQERRIHDAAQNEATELVWQHKNPGVTYKNPHAPYRNPDWQAGNHPFLQHLEKGSHARSQSLVYRDSVSYPYNHSDDSSGSNSGADTDNPRINPTPGDIASPEEVSVIRSRVQTKKPKVNFAHDVQILSDRRGSGVSRFRSVSGDSSKGIFRNPEDQIYEEPEESDSPAEENSSTVPDSSALRVKPRNSLSQGYRHPPARLPDLQKVSPVDIHKNPPSQSRNPLYKMNLPNPPLADLKVEEAVRTKDGIEIRSDEIRAATSMRLKDRSVKLPMPTAVSGRPGQPIVSFDPNWKSVEQQSRNNSIIPRKQDSNASRKSSVIPPESEPPTPTVMVSEIPSVPTINLSEGSDDKNPSIHVFPTTSSDGRKNDTRPPRNPKQTAPRRRLDPKKMAPVSQNRWYSPFNMPGLPTAACVTCSLPISGRIVTAAESRFHPECFTCHHCSTPLECVAFYQEPETKRAERLSKAASDDDDAEALRFYCHLDFHELFSPRCKSCKTPIEGEVVVACGAEWHVGHFFCAECGDPFTQETPFVEKDGFAWCLRCHSRRTASRCLGCKQPVLDEVVVTALGGQWHEDCFVCHECSNGFGPEGRFFIKEGGPKRSTKGRIIGGPVQLAVCENCEAIRLKASS